MKASAIVTRKRPAARVLRLAPEDFAATYEARPTEGIAVGLRLISDAEESEARSQASAAAGSVSVILQSTEEYNDALVAGLVGAALCHPDDDSQDPPGLPLMRDMVRSRLTSRAIRRLYHELDVLAADISPGVREATDEEIDGLMGAILEEDVELTNRARRLLASVIEELDTDES